MVRIAKILGNFKSYVTGEEELYHTVLIINIFYIFWNLQYWNTYIQWDQMMNLIGMPYALCST